MVEVKAFLCTYCGFGPVCDPDLMREHEKRCNCNPNKEYCSCSLCVHSEIRHYDTTGYQHRPIVRGYGHCTIGLGGKFDYIHNYCANFERKESTIR